MKIYLETAIFKNRSPFNKLELEFSENEIAVLSAINGKGKTTIISHLADAFYEMAKPHFTDIIEDKSQYYRVSSALFNLKKKEPSFVYFRFKIDGETVDYVDIINHCTKEQYSEAIRLKNKIDFESVIENNLNQNNNIKVVSDNFDKKLAKKIFENNIITYFPSYRFEIPGYLNEPNKIKLDFSKTSKFVNKLNKKIEVISGLDDLANWIMDIVLDMQIDNHANQIKLNLDNIFTNILFSKNYGKVTFVVGERNSGSTRIKIIKDTDENKNSYQGVYPNIFNLSSGESSLLCLFGEILKQADSNRRSLKTNQITGIVLIDEVDKHLHIRLQKEILPRLFQLFPNIQFIVSSHSPFFSMGLAENNEAQKRAKIISLDNFGISKAPYTDELYTEVYNMMIGENERFKEMYESLEQKIKESSIPLIITEGKTDIKHIKKAKETLEINDFTIDFIDPECQPDGFTNLQALLEKLSKIKHQRKIIGVFDRDEDAIIKDIEKGNQTLKSYGNDVYAFCISPPTFRKEKGQEKISIEYLYKDDEIKTMLDNNCRLFFGTEFTRSSMYHNTENNLTLNKPKGKGEDKILENNNGQAVYSEKDINILAKKDDFANAIFNKKIEITNDSWENFRHIFDKIREIINNNEEIK